MGGNSIWNHGLSNSRGVAILFSEKFNYIISDITRDIPGRKISCKINVSGQHSLYLVNVYLSNSGQERKNFICNSINIDRQKLNCVAGDFNCTLLKHLDKIPYPSATMLELMNSESLLKNTTYLIFGKLVILIIKDTRFRGVTHNHESILYLLLTNITT